MTLTVQRADTAPPVSVVMSAWNEAPYITAAVESVLAQRFNNFELVIRDDGSDDGTGELLTRMAAQDQRIRLERGSATLGLAGGGNAVVAAARAPIVARMDADDIAHPEWLERLFETITQRPEAVLVGCLWSGIDAQGRHTRVADRWRAARPSVFPPFGHGSSMFRKAAFERCGGYRQPCEYWEDLDLVLRLSREGSILFLPRTLYLYRAATSSTRRVSDQAKVERAVDTMFACMTTYEDCGDYEHMLGDAARAANDHEPYRPSLRASVALSSNRLWNGERPGRLRHVIAGLRPPFTAEKLASLIAAIWAEVHPRSLRSVLAGLIRLRALFAKLPSDGSPVLWSPAEATERRER